MQKRILSLLLALVMVFGLFPAVSASEIASGTCGENLTWVLTDNGTMTISGNGDMNYEDYPNPWYDHSTSIKKVVIERGVTSINFHAFLDCTNLTSVSIADTVTDIWGSAFENCEKLSSLTIPDSVTHICNLSFTGSAIEEITIPINAEVCDDAFYNCPSLKAIHVAEGNPYLSSDNGVLLNKDRTYLRQCPTGYEGFYAIPDTVTDVYYDAFLFCHKLTGVSIPASLSENPPDFSGCESLSNVTFAEGVTTIGGFSSGFYSLTEITLPQSLTTIKPFAFDRTSIKNIYIPASVTRIGVYALNSLWLETVTFSGDAPEVYANFDDQEGDTVIPYGVNVTIYYPADNPTWTQEARDAISTAATWVPYNPNSPFLDVPAGAWFEAPVLWALENGITTGTSDTTFSPGDKCLRAHVVTFLWNAEKCPEPAAASSTSTDVPAGAWYEKPVLWAVENGITSGTSATKFGAGDVCSRYQVVFFLWKAAGSPEPKTTVNPFTDVNPGHFFYKAVLWAVENGITSGTSATTFGPTVPCNRAQVVTFLYAAYN